MRKLTAIATCVVAFSCCKSSLPQNYYYGVITDGENRYRFGLDNTKRKPTLTIISFQAMEDR